MDTKRAMLRHCLATLAYRGGKVLRNVPDDFAEFSAHETTRTPSQIVAHLGDLLDWGLSMARGQEKWINLEPGDWKTSGERFFSSLKAFDDYLASDEALGVTEERLFQGPIADSFTHVGQLAMLSRMAGQPIRAENYSKASIEPGRVGDDQKPPKFEFD